ncbi:uncharacterized protein LAJ45_07459 [Morchella importuna]|uniref:Uncharacterized protein n=1 Tax=Morchella conica CCBAS932 TaxID=1392247 RepID=A0A3N4LD59_9PEZI|nr:uncharacterized protein LAJ45_07459 [Morchella importuna]KAH8148358.1 hypothetical protein LAJ45_07459 [Morchella importuna]RPB15915.1 hypothetical protein P167DRAFT_383252 [Morchella conica CCBAS932]
MPRKDSETLPAIFLHPESNGDSEEPQFTVSTTPATAPQNKPKIAPMPPSSDLLSRLNAFLPAISAANRDLEGEIAAGTIAQRNIENVSEKEEAYIEMNLGLGVLKQIDPNNPDESESESEEEEEKEKDSDAGAKAEEKDILGKLLQRPARGKPGIQEVEDQAPSVKRDDDDMDIDPLEKR